MCDRVRVAEKRKKKKKKKKNFLALQNILALATESSDQTDVLIRVDCTCYSNIHTNTHTTLRNSSGLKYVSQSLN